MPRKSVLTEPCIRVDELLSKLTGMPEGSLISYTEVTRKLHEYIRTHNLRRVAAIIRYTMPFEKEEKTA